MRTLLLLFAIFLVPALWGQTQITEESYGPGRTAANLSEIILNTSNVNTASFGKLFSYTVDTSIFAQPLFVPNVPVSGKGTHNVVYAATMANTLYAFDADMNQPTLWSVNFGAAVGPHYQGGIIYLVNTANMGKEWAGNGQIVQSFSNGETGFFSGGIFNGGSFYNNANTPTYYIWSNSFALNAYHFNGATLSLPATARSSLPGPAESYGASLAVSASGSTAGTGIVWAAMPDISGLVDGNENPGILRAFDATTLTELWNSSLKSSDSFGLWSKFRSPVVANGKVYLGSIAGANGPPATLSVYGLICTNVPQVTNVFIELNNRSSVAGPSVLILSVN